MRFNNFWDYRRILFSKGFASAVWHARKNVLAFDKSRPLAAGPYMAELDVTYRCNCRCQMCQRWQDPRNNELRVDEYEALAGVLDHPITPAVIDEAADQVVTPRDGYESPGGAFDISQLGDGHCRSPSAACAGRQRARARADRWPISAT